MQIIEVRRKTILIIIFFALLSGFYFPLHSQQYLTDDEKVALLAPENQSSEVITAALDLDLTLEDIQYANQLKKAGISDQAIILVIQERLILNEKEEAILKKSKKPGMTLQNILEDRQGKGIWLVQIPAGVQWTFLTILESYNEIDPRSGFHIGAGGIYMISRHFGWMNSLNMASYHTFYYSNVSDLELKLSTLNMDSEFIIFSRIPGRTRAYTSVGLVAGLAFFKKEAIQFINSNPHDFTETFQFLLPLSAVGQFGGSIPIANKLEFYSAIRMEVGMKDLSNNPDVTSLMLNLGLTGGLNIRFR